MEALRKKINDVLSSYPGRWGFVIANQATGARLDLNPDMVFLPPSMIKVPVMYEIMRQAVNGKLSLDDTLMIKDADKVGGAGILKELDAGKVFTVRELVTLMIILSDNMATNMLIDLIGMETVNQTVADLGLQSTVLRQDDGFCGGPGGQREPNFGSRHGADFCKNLYFGRSAPGIWGTYAGYSGPPANSGQAPFLTPEGITIAHKTGTL